MAALLMNSNDERAVLRSQLRQQRLAWLATPEGQAAPAAVLARLAPLLQELEPLCLGLYAPLAGEFDPAPLLPLQGVQLALPYAEKAAGGGGAMHYRRWDGRPPSLRDGMGIPACEGAPAEPDLVLVPCLGFTREGFRLGYGGGFFDRWLSQHPGVTAVGLAWGVSECRFAPEPHDQALSILVTDRALLAP
jgi:5-formyltetrahydrofolate cyclo-ligase